ncbi:MAG: sulfite exporter TauE/SafE family protein [Elainellaceae cyanobacterium]
MNFPDLFASASTEPTGAILVLLCLVGIGVGILAALLGIGGGLLMVPILTLWGATPIQAIATSLVGIVLSSTSGTFQNWRTGRLNLERVAILAPPAMLTTELGVWLANALPPNLLLISFAALQVLAIYLVGLKQELKAAVPAQASVGVLTGYSNSGKGPALPVSKGDRPSHSLNTSDLFKTQGVGLVAGVLSGLFGVGGGIIMVPLQMLFLGEGIKDAVRTSLGAITLISVWAVGRHALSGNVLWFAGIALGLGGLLGAQLGARLLPKLPDSWVKVLFRGLLLLLACYMVSKAVLAW